MVTEFAFDTHFFDSKSLTTAGQSAVHDSILQMWRDYGVLVLNAKKFDTTLDLIKKFPIKYQQRWKEALEYNRTLIIENDWGDFCDYDEFSEVTKLCTIFQTGLAEDDIGRILSGNEDATIHCKSTGFELLGAGAVSESINFKASRTAGTTGISFGTSAQDIWAEKIAPLAKHSKNITIIDRYLYTRVRDGLTRGSISSGALGFLRMLSESDRKFNVKIISGGNEKNSDAYHEIINYFQKHVVKSAPIAKALNGLTLISNHDNFFRDYAHERFIRFDAHICEIGLGVQIFENHPSPMTGFSLKHISETSFNEREQMSAKQVLWRDFLI
ncbi:MULTISPECIES: hypothetical protein [Pseudomonas syringae group]|uniref:Uncharacterized protein n=3 Tax=Pseudomonas syringae group TaxID=136849 RepID=A0A2K4WZJ8_PSESX|nr:MULTISPECIES: hypothetical protein [Pseudomonas syringae group]AVB13540.1 hypothetical protein BKM19_007905 [Pseudomonas amygdali pv. morsprunorum]KPX17538.1 Uncharacterized protein ALO71_02116 [Pseudomonas amygdali pv. dendropanacis]KWS51394.1 hypothetical protein AL056_12700 [Pseudomonas amygdali pv. morsprunorum]KWS69593.1 hypothetical protein AL054_17750 [Pseudomonas amygdali pv. morsprunorum]KWS74536.1 hypothetical protein AL051_11995 [Pseudomonas amygdali pv. dendropanacis]